MRFKRLMPKPSESPRSFVSMTKLLGGYHLWQSQDDNRTAPQKLRIRKEKMPMGNVSYSAHISNGKSAITSKKHLQELQSITCVNINPQITAQIILG